MEAVCSTLIARIQLADLMPHFLTPPRVVFAKARQGYVNTGDYAKDYEAGIVRAEQRNVTIAKIARVLSYENGIPTVVLTKAREHADTLGEMISGSITVKGGGGAHEGIAAFNDGKYDVLVGTSVIGEGVDLPRAAALVFAGGGAATVQMMQSYYRPLTAQPGKTVGLIYDFQDDHNRTLNRHSAERIAFAREHLGDCVVVL
jgi:superfamily II DNA or RNA helicase